MNLRAKVAMSVVLSAGGLSLCAGLSGCTAGEDYHRPALTVSQRFSAWPSTQPATAPTTQAAGSTTAPPLTDLAHWWAAMNDPELNRLLDRAVASNLDVVVAIARLQESRALLAEFVGQSLPELKASGVLGQGTGSSVTRGGQVDGPINAASNSSGLKEITQAFGVDSQFEIDLFGTLRREAEAAGADTAAAAEFRNQVLVTLLGDVTRDYVLIRTLQERITLAEQAIAAQAQSANVVNERYVRGITNELDLALANRELETMRAGLPPLQAQLLATKRNLAVLLGERPDGLMKELDAQSPLPQPPAEIEAGLPIDLLRRRPDVRQAEAQLIAANARLGVATSLLYPRVFLSAAAGVQGQGLGKEPVEWRGIWDVAPAFSWPILDFGTMDAQVQARDQETRAAIANFQKVVLRAIAEVDNGLTSYDAQRRRLGNLGQAVTAAQRALTLANERYNRGIIDYLNVLDAERSLYGLQDEQAVSEDAAVADFVDVCQALGGGWEGFPPPPPLKGPLPALLASVRDVTGNSDKPLGK